MGDFRVLPSSFHGYSGCGFISRSNNLGVSDPEFIVIELVRPLSLALTDLDNPGQLLHHRDKQLCLLGFLPINS